MADQLQHSEDGEKIPNSTPDSQLEYPQLLIEASFESLLSHSQSSAPRTVVHMPRSEVSLGESWSSLSEHDLSHDDDLHSDATDTGSLIDVSTAGDIHTVDDNGQSSEAEPDDDDDGNYNEDSAEEDNQLDKNGSREMRESRMSTEHANTPGQNSIRLDDSTVIVDRSGVTSLQASRSFTPAEMKLRSSQSYQYDESVMVEETIEIAMSPENLQLPQRPYHILYHGSKYCSPEMRPEVLGKIGAALISSGDQQKMEDSAKSPCYHIIPSEFGPGSRPSTADLIPIPTQMHITECTVLDSNSKSAADPDICLQLSTGRRVISRRAKLFESLKKQGWTPPDLVVIVVSHNDTRRDRAQAEDIAEFAARHRIATICLRQEYTWDGDDFLTRASPHMLLRQVKMDSQITTSGPLEHVTLLDADTFLSLDAEQLNQHLNYLTISTSVNQQGQASFSRYFNSRPGTVYHKLSKILPNRLWKRTQNVDTRSADTTQWSIDTWSSISDQDQQPIQEQEKTVHIRNTKEYASMLASLHNIATLVVVAILTMFTFYACQTAFTYLITMNTRVPRISMTGSFQDPRCLSSTVTVSISAATALSMSNSALSGPYQPAEPQIQHWTHQSVVKEKDSSEPRNLNEIPKQSEDIAGTVCQKVVSAQISRNLKMSKEFFHSDKPRVSVMRGNEEVVALVRQRSEFTVAILIQRKDMYGKFTVYLGEGEQKTCAVIDLENLWEETLTRWANSIPETYKKHKRLERLANRWTELLEVRAPETGFAGNALELKYSAAQGLGAVVEVVEKATVKHAKACQKLGEQGLMHILGLPDQQLALPVEHARQLSEDMIRNTRKQVDEMTRQAKDRASKAVEQAKDEVSRAVQVVQSSIHDLSVLPGTVSKRLAEAQLRAQKLVEKSGLGRRNGQRSA